MEREVMIELSLCFGGWVVSAAALYFSFVIFFSI